MVRSLCHFSNVIDAPPWNRDLPVTNRQRVESNDRSGTNSMPFIILISSTYHVLAPSQDIATHRLMATDIDSCDNLCVKTLEPIMPLHIVLISRVRARMSYCDSMYVRAACVCQAAGMTIELVRIKKKPDPLRTLHDGCAPHRHVLSHENRVIH